MIRFAPVIALLLCAEPAFATAPAPLPDAVRDMLNAAIASGNDSDIDAVARIARQTNPDAAVEVDAMVAEHRQERTEATQQRIRSASFFEIWSGKGEFGLFRSTGTASEFGVSGGLSLKREGLQWKHLLRVNADYRRANGETSRESILAAYEPRYQLNDKSFTYALVQYERDPFIGFDERYTASTGIGYTAVSSERTKLSIDTGPAYRYVHYTEDGIEERVGLRSSLDFNMKLTPTLTFQQNAYGYVEKDRTSLSSLTALDAKILSRLSTRFSYSTAFESETELTPESFDTLSKVTLIYDF